MIRMILALSVLMVIFAICVIITVLISVRILFMVKNNIDPVVAIAIPKAPKNMGSQIDREELNRRLRKELLETS